MFAISAIACIIRKEYNRYMLYFLIIPAFFILLATIGMYANQSPMLGENFLRWNVLALFLIGTIFFYTHLGILGKFLCFVCFIISLISAYAIHEDGIYPDKWR